MGCISSGFLSSLRNRILKTTALNSFQKYVEQHFSASLYILLVILCSSGVTPLILLFSLPQSGMATINHLWLFNLSFILSFITTFSYVCSLIFSSAIDNQVLIKS